MLKSTVNIAPVTAAAQNMPPNVFILDDDGYNADRGNEIDVPAGEEENAKRGMKSCPERAITLVAE